jgi:two-component system, response regulator PdtaR
VKTEDDRSLAGSQILVVEDDGLIAFQVIDVLKGWGCTVLGPAATASAALELLKMQTPDAAVLDVELRDGTSAPVAKVLEQCHRPYILLTAMQENEIPEPMRHAARLQKPIDERKLRASLGELIAK